MWGTSIREAGGAGDVEVRRLQLRDVAAHPHEADDAQQHDAEHRPVAAFFAIRGRSGLGQANDLLGGDDLTTDGRLRVRGGRGRPERGANQQGAEKAAKVAGKYGVSDELYHSARIVGTR